MHRSLNNVAIVAAIEEQFSRLDAGVAALERVRTNLKRYRTAVLKAGVEGRLTEAWREENPHVESASDLLKRILKERRELWEKDQLAAYEKKGKKPPKNWQSRYKEPTSPDEEKPPTLPTRWCWVTVLQTAELVTDGDHNPPPRVVSGVPHLTAKNVTGTHLDFSGCSYITPEDAERVFRRYKPMPDDLLVTCVGTIGRTAIVPEGVTFSPDRNLAAIRTVLGKTFVHFLQFCLMSPDFQVRMSKLSGSTAQPHLYLGDLRALYVPLPALAEQAKIISEVQRRLSIVQEVETEVEAALKRASRLRQSILKRAFEGNLMPQDPSDEPASELLERIRREREQASLKKPKRRTKKMAAAKVDPAGHAGTLF